MMTVPIERTLLVAALGVCLYLLPPEVVSATGSALAAGSWMWPRRP